MVKQMFLTIIIIISFYIWLFAQESGLTTDQKENLEIVESIKATYYVIAGAFGIMSVIVGVAIAYLRLYVGNQLLVTKEQINSHIDQKFSTKESLTELKTEVTELKRDVKELRDKK